MQHQHAGARRLALARDHALKAAVAKAPGSCRPTAFMSLRLRGYVRWRIVLRTCPRNTMWCVVILLFTSCASVSWYARRFVPLQEAAKFLAQKMADELTAMPIDEAMPICRACGHYLNLTSIAETHHRCHPCAQFTSKCLHRSSLAESLRHWHLSLQCADNKDAWHELKEL